MINWFLVYLISNVCAADGVKHINATVRNVHEKTAGIWMGNHTRTLMKPV